MSQVPENIIIGKPLVSLQLLGITEEERTVHFTFDELRNPEKGNIFLPHVLIKVGIFTSTNECRRINIQRQKSSKFNKDPNLNLWRDIDKPEFTFFKIGKKSFWLIIGQ